MKKIIGGIVVLGFALLVIGSLYGRGGENVAHPNQSASVSVVNCSGGGLDHTGSIMLGALVFGGLQIA